MLCAGTESGNGMVMKDKFTEIPFGLPWWRSG